MEWQMNALSNLGLLSRFVGMITDSRSFMSYRVTSIFAERYAVSSDATWRTENCRQTRVARPDDPQHLLQQRP